eukprot:jgi/Tetstr1/440165/TSEL_028521.t1
MGLPLPLALACALVLVSTTRLTNAVVEVPVCALVSSVHGGAEVGAVERAPEVTAAMQGLDDANSRGCRLVSRDAGNCNRLVESADVHVTLRMLGIWALRGVPDDGAAANAILECAKLGGWTDTTPLSLAQISGPGFIRTAVSDKQRSYYLMQLSKKMGWAKAVVIHGPTASDRAMAEALREEGIAEDIAVSSFAIPHAASPGASIAESVAHLVLHNERVVIMAMPEEDMVAHLVEYRNQGLDVAGRVWISARPCLEDVIHAAEARPAGERAVDLLQGLLAVGFDPQLPALVPEDSRLAQPGWLHEDMLHTDGSAATDSGSPPTDSERSVSLKEQYAAAAMYDAVWATASGWAAASAVGNGTRPPASAVLQRLADGRSVRFQGASGTMGWSASGDLDASSVPGDEMPHVFPRALRTALIATCSVLLACAALVGVLLLVRSRRRAAEADGPLEAAQLLAELRSGGSVQWIDERERGEIAAFLARFDANLGSKQLQERMERVALTAPPAEADKGEMGEGLPALRESLSDQEHSRQDYSANMLEMLGAERSDDSSGSSGGLVPASRTLEAAEPKPLRDSSAWRDSGADSAWGGSFTAAKNCALEQLPQLRAVRARNVVVPPHLASAIAMRFDLDMITASSPIMMCPSPLATVVRHCVSLFGLEEQVPSARMMGRLMAYVQRLEAGYMDGGYHCKLHAADVTNRFATILWHTGIARASSAAEMLPAVVAAALHDYKHPQVTNNFLVMRESGGALAFNDQSVTENVSVRAALGMLRSEPELNFLEEAVAKYGRGGMHKFRRLVIDVVLGTDMKRHFDLLRSFKQDIGAHRLAGARAAGSAALWVALDDSQKVLVLQVALKIADIGHCALPMAQHREWCLLLQEEMFRQGDREKRMGMPTSPLMDRDRPGVFSAKSQVGFFDVIVLPLYRAFVDVFPECQPLLQQAELNRAHWSRKANPGGSRVSHDHRMRSTGFPQRNTVASFTQGGVPMPEPRRAVRRSITERALTGTEQALRRGSVLPITAGSLRREP